MRTGGLVAVAACVAATAVVLLALLWAMQRHLIYLPDTSTVPPADDVIPGAENVRLDTSDGLTLGGWYVPATGPRRDVSVLVANGNGGSRTLRAPLARALATRGMDVLLFDYRGYAGNPGSPTEAGLARDVRAARDALLRRSGNPVIYFGESLGAAVVTELAREHPPDGLVLRSPFVDLAAVGRVHYPFLPVRTLLRDRFPLVEHLAKVRVPTVVLYGSKDRVVPPGQSRAVAEAAPGDTEVVVVRGVGHNDRELLDGAVLVDSVEQLARRVADPID